MQNEPIVSGKTPDDFAKIGAKWLAKHSQGQTVNRRGRPRKQAENGLSDGSQIPPETAPGSGSVPSVPSAPVDSDESPKRSQARRGGTQQAKSELIPAKLPAAVYGDAFLSQHEIPVFLLFGSQWLKYDNLKGWRLCADDGQARRLVDRFLSEQYKGVFTEKLSRDVFAYIRAKWWINKEFNYKSWKIYTDPETGSLEAVEAPFWLACENCLLNVKTRDTKPFTPRLVVLGRIPCNYDRAADCKTFESFISSVIPSEYRETLLMACGLSLIYERRKSNVFFILCGPPGTGKSTFVNILKLINEGTVCKVPLADFGERFGTSDLTTHRVNIVEEMEDMREGGQATEREAVLKSVTCGELIKIEEKYQKAVARPGLALNIFTVNEMPKFVDQSNAISDRLRVFPFRNKFRGTSKQKTGIEEEIAAELPGVLNLFLEYLHRYFEIVDSQTVGTKTFPECKAGTEEKEQAIRQSRPWETWFEENTEKALEVNGIPAHALYELYRDDTQASGYRPIGENLFKKLLFEYYERQGVKLKKDRVRIAGGQKTYIYGLNSPRLNSDF